MTDNTNLNTENQDHASLRRKQPSSGDWSAETIERVLNNPKIPPLQKALLYAKLGIKIFPVKADEKAPVPDLMPTEQELKDGKNNWKTLATDDADKIQKWWDAYPNANIGIPSLPNGYFVIDIDCKTGKPNGLEELEKNYPEIYSTIQELLNSKVETPSGGCHICIRSDGLPVFDRTNGLHSNRACESVDIKAKGYVVGAGSTINGKAYLANNIDFQNLPNCPANLLEFFVEAEREKTEEISLQSKQTSEFDDSPDIQELQNILSYISPDLGYDEWVSVLMGCNYEYGDASQSIVENWSAGGNKYKPGEVGKKWRSFKSSDSGITLGTVIKIAQDGGYKPPKKEPYQTYGPYGPLIPGNENQKEEKFEEGEPPLELPGELLPVMDFNRDFLPTPLADYCEDCADRMDIPMEMVAIPAVVAMSTPVGRSLGVRPKLHDNYTVVANMWGLVCAPPGSKKSPAMNDGLKALYQLEEQAREEFKPEKDLYELEQIDKKWKAEAAKKQAQKILDEEARKSGKPDLRGKERKAGNDVDYEKLLKDAHQEGDEQPTARRYIVQNATTEVMAEIVRKNAVGVLGVFDELKTLFDELDADKSGNKRGFLKTGWNGNSPYNVDRIMRGEDRYIPAVCIGMIGTIQNNVISYVVRSAINGDKNDDGLLQRFGLMVMPDFSPVFHYVDRAPGAYLYERVYELFNNLNEIDPRRIGASKDEDTGDDPRNIPYLRFSEGGAERYRYWIESLLTEAKSGDFHPALANHFSKYEKLIPGLALLAHLGDRKVGSIDEMSVQKALEFGDYLKTHAERIYTCTIGTHAKHAKLILQKIRTGLLGNQFNAREIYKKRWSSLTELDDVNEAIKLLIKYGWLFPENVETGGIPKFVYTLNKLAKL